MSRTEILHGDCLDLLKTLDDQSINCCVTSPPYFGLRDYGTAQWVGGDLSCSHKIGEIRTGKGMSELGKKYAGGGHKASEPKPLYAKDECQHCGSVRVDKQIGQEQTPEEFVKKLVDVFREVKRVLKDDGTLWLNLGDSYYNYRPGAGQKMSKQTVSNTNQDLPETCPRRGNKLDGLKEKDLIGIPWRVAFALQDDGWYLRQDIIWHKPNPMPESVTDRCTKSHEYIFLFSKSQKYYFDNAAIREPVKSIKGNSKSFRGGGNYTQGKSFNNSLITDRESHGNNPSTDGMRNKRSVWTVATKPFKGAHFATFPEDLIKPCILAGCPKNGTVLDPFGGAGTVGVVAESLGRNAILCELNPEYIEIAEKRINAGRDLFVGCSG